MKWIVKKNCGFLENSYQIKGSVKTQYQMEISSTYCDF